MLRFYKYPEVQDQLKDETGNVLFAIQNANTYKPLPFQISGDNSAISSFSAKKVDSKGNLISTTSLSVGIIQIDSTNNLYYVDGATVYASLLDECIYYFEIQNGSELYKSELFLIQIEEIYFTCDNDNGTIDEDTGTIDETKITI